MSDWEKLFDFEDDFDVNLLESIAVSASSPKGQTNEQFQLANDILQRFREDPRAWTRVPTILDYAQHPQTKRFALTVMDGLVLQRWNSLPTDQQTNIREYMISYVMNLSSSADVLETSKLVLDKANGVVVSIARQDWPHRWPDFVPDIVQASKSNESTCENNLQILMLLSEEIFDFSTDKMTRAKISKLKESLVKDFYPIYSLCEYVLANSKTPSLLKATLEALHRFLSWIPEGYIFGTDMLNILLGTFLPEEQFRIMTVNCLIEIAQIPADDTHRDKFQQLFVLFMEQLSAILPAHLDMALAYSQGTHEERIFVHKVALFLSSFFKTHLLDVETDDLVNALLAAHNYLVQFCYVKDKEVFRTVLEYWTFLSAGLYNEAAIIPGNAALPTQRRQFYAEVLKEVRVILISNMAKPEEFLIVEDENGNLEREKMKNTEQLDLYKCMKETLVYCANLDMANTTDVMIDSLQHQSDHADEFSKRNCSTLCWAIGSISGVQSEDQEKLFLVRVIRTLIAMCNNTRVKDHRAVIAGNIMYVVGQYPRFLKAYWTFLKTVVSKLFEWMSEMHPGVQDMACDTFLKIARRTKSRFVATQPKEERPFVEDIIANVANFIAFLDDNQVYTFYAAVGELISAADPAQRGELTSRLMFLPNASWQDIMAAASQDVNSLRQLDTIRKIAHLIKTNTHACQRVGHHFIGQIETIYLEMLNVYRVYSEDISQAVQQQGPRYLRTVDAKAKRTVKASILLLLQAFIGTTTRPQGVVEDLLPPLLIPVLEDYRNGIPEARDPEVLGLVTALVTKCNDLIAGEIPRIFDYVFACTMQMIEDNLTDFPDHRIQFFGFLRAVNKHCFRALLDMSPDNFKLIIDSIVWAFRHTMRGVAKTGLQLLVEMLDNVEQAGVADPFYSTWFLPLLNELLAVLTNGFHKSEMPHQAKVLIKLFAAAQDGIITAPVWDPADTSVEPGTTNVQYVGDYTCNLVATAFANLSASVVTNFVQGMFTYCHDQANFKKHLQDFLVQVSEVSDPDADVTDLFQEDLAAEVKAKKDEDTQLKLAIPGMVAPDDPRRPENASNGDSSALAMDDDV